MDNCILEAHFNHSFIPEMEIKKEIPLDHIRLKKGMVRTLRMINNSDEELAEAVRIITLYIHFCDYYRLKGGKYLNNKQEKLRPDVEIRLLDLLNAYEIGVKMDWAKPTRSTSVIIACSYLSSFYLSNKEIDEVCQQVIKITDLKRKKQ